MINLCSGMTTHPLFQGLLMGGAIYGLDLLLRPSLATSNVMEILLFFIEGVGCDFVYRMMNKPDSSSACSFAFDVKKSTMAGVTIWLTDIFLRPQMFNGLISEIMKFFIQGMLVMLVFNYSPSS